MDSYNTRMCLAGSGQAFEENGKKESEILRIFTARKIEVVMDALERLAARVKPGERPLIVAFGSDILEYVVMGLHQRYPEWIGRVDVAGFAQAGTADKLGIECSLVIKNPESVGITAAELLHKKLIGEKKEDTTRVYDIKVQDQF